MFKPLVTSLRRQITLSMVQEQQKTAHSNSSLLQKKKKENNKTECCHWCTIFLSDHLGKVSWERQSFLFFCTMKSKANISVLSYPIQYCMFPLYLKWIKSILQNNSIRQKERNTVGNPEIYAHTEEPLQVYQELISVCFFSQQRSLVFISAVLSYYSQKICMNPWKQNFENFTGFKPCPKLTSVF